MTQLETTFIYLLKFNYGMYEKKLAYKADCLVVQ